MGRMALHRIFLLLVVVLAAAVLPAKPLRAAGDATAHARSLYVEGVKQQKAGRLAEAREAFAKAFRLKKHFQIAGNLGSVELELKRYRDAAEHLSWALADIQRESKAATEDVNAIAERLRVAQAQVVTLRLKVSLLAEPHTAFQLLLDGKAIGSSAGLAFMPAGRHRLLARSAGAVSLTRSITAQAGESVDLVLDLRPAGAGLAANAERIEKAAQTGRPAWPLWGAASMAAVGLVGTVTFWALNASHGGKADDLAAQIQSDSGQNPHNACDLTDGALFDRCNAWRDQRAHATDTGALALASTVALASSTAFGLVYALLPPKLFGQKSSGDGGTSKASVGAVSRLAMVPVVSGQGAGFQLMGSF